MLTFHIRFSRHSFRSDVRHVIYLQSCIGRRLARKELKALKAEARSVSKFKEISYKLENKVVELTQNLQKRTEEKRDLQAKLTELEQQLQQWVNRHEESDSRVMMTLKNEVSSLREQLNRSNALNARRRRLESSLQDLRGQKREKTAIGKTTTILSLTSTGCSNYEANSQKMDLLSTIQTST